MCDTFGRMGYPAHMGRPSKFTKVLAAEICERLAISPAGLITVCRDEHMPDVRTIYRWLDAHESFRLDYARARALQSEYLLDMAMDVASTPQIGSTVTSEAGPGGLTHKVVETDMTAHRKLLSDTIKWHRGHLMSPKNWGQKAIAPTAPAPDVADDGTVTIIGGLPD